MGREIGKKKVDFFSSFFTSGWVDVHHEASASSSTTTAPRVRVIVTLSISLYFSLPRWFLSCHHRLNVVPFFFYVYPKTLLFVTVILDGIFSFVARACVHIFTRFSLSLRFKCIARVYIYIARERKKKHTPQALFLLRLSREEVNDKNRLWELQ